MALPDRFKSYEFTPSSLVVQEVVELLRPAGGTEKTISIDQASMIELLQAAINVPRIAGDVIRLATGSPVWQKLPREATQARAMSPQSAAGRFESMQSHFRQPFCGPGTTARC